MAKQRQKVVVKIEAPKGVRLKVEKRRRGGHRKGKRKRKSKKG
jgi:hypothetical protein